MRTDPEWLKENRPIRYWMAIFSAERRAERAAAELAPQPLLYRPNRRMTPSERAAYVNSSKPMWSRLIAAQGRRCYLCDKVMLKPSEDHVRPKARGGRNRANRLMACTTCNNRKGSRLPFPCEMLFLGHINLVVLGGARPVERAPRQEAA